MPPNLDQANNGISGNFSNLSLSIAASPLQIPVRHCEGKIWLLDRSKLDQSTYFKNTIRDIDEGIKQPPIPIDDISEVTFDLVVEYFNQIRYPPAVPGAPIDLEASIHPAPSINSEPISIDSETTINSEWADLIQHASVYGAAVKLGIDVLKDCARSAYGNAIRTCDTDILFYINSTSMIYKPGFDDNESRPSTPGPPAKRTMKWWATHGLVDYLPRVFFHHRMLQDFCRSNGEYCYDLMAAIVEDYRVKDKPMANLIKHQTSKFAFKILCCQDRRFAFRSLRFLMEEIRYLWPHGRFESSEDDEVGELDDESQEDDQDTD